MKTNKVAFLMGSESDREVVEKSKKYFKFFGIDVDYIVSSAHRNPDKTGKLAAEARANGYSVVICAAGMAAHLAGVCASHTDLPVIGVPLKGGILDGVDALLSTVQMPSGIPVATMAVGKAGVINSAVYCAKILSLQDEDIARRLAEFKSKGSKL